MSTVSMFYLFPPNLDGKNCEYSVLFSLKTKIPLKASSIDPIEKRMPVLFFKHVFMNC